MPIRQGVASWPGVQGVVSCTYTCSHGAAPGTAVLVCHPQAQAPATFGALTISDGITTITMPGCRMDNLYGPRGEGEKTWTLEIVDRRWRWRDLGFVNGVYNQRDPRGKILFWTLRSIPDLMAICLAAMGETNYTLNLPVVTTSTEQIYPAIEWDAVNPAHALTQLCERIGCRVVYRVKDNSVLITSVGVGAPLPNGPLAREGPSLKSPETPDSILLVGAPVRYQARFALMAVGKEWDGSYRPIDYLSYAPGAHDLVTRQVSTVTPANVTAGNRFTATINGVLFQYIALFSTVADVTAGLVALINASVKSVMAGISATDNGTSFTVTGNPLGQAFTISTAGFFGTGTTIPKLTSVLTTPPVVKTTRWGNCLPPGFHSVTPTDRLSLNQAKEFARESVFKTYQIINLDPNAHFFGKIKPLNIPGFGPIARVQQVIPQETQVVQITPQAADPNITGPDGLPLDKAFYDGYQHDKPAQVFGSYWPGQSGVRFNSESQNTTVDQEVLVPFHIDAERLLVKFDQYVFAINNTEQNSPADLTLETGCLVRELVSNQIVRFSATKVLATNPAQTPPAVVRHEDVQLNFIGLYDQFTSGLTGVLTDLDLATAMANYYLAGEAVKYQLQAGLERIYRGIVLISCDGAIQQVTWKIGGGKPAETQASRQFEHSTYIPTFPERLKFQYLNAAVKGGPEQPDRLAGEDLYAPTRWAGKPK